MPSCCLYPQSPALLICSTACVHEVLGLPWVQHAPALWLLGSRHVCPFLYCLLLSCYRPGTRHAMCSVTERVTEVVSRGASGLDIAGNRPTSRRAWEVLREEVRANVSPDEYGVSIASRTSMWLRQETCTRALLRHQDRKLLHTQDLPCVRRPQPVGRPPHQALSYCRWLPVQAVVQCLSANRLAATAGPVCLPTRAAVCSAEGAASN